MSVDLNNLRIEEESHRGGRWGLPVVILMLVLLAGGFAGGWFLHGGSSGSLGGAIAVRTTAVRSEGGADARSGGAGFNEGGWIEVPSYHPIVVSALLPGRVEELNVLEGSRVDEGQVVARLYSRNLADALRLAEAEVEAAKAELDLMLAGYREEDVERARQDVERLKSQADLLAGVAERTRDLVPKGAASPEDLERDRSAHQVAVATLKSAQAELAKLQAGFRKEEIARARAALTKAEAARDLAKVRLDWTEVRSPAAGVVFERFVTPGTYLTEGHLRLVSLYDPTDLQARVDVRQENARRVHVGQTVEISTEAEPDKVYVGTVIRVEPMADPKKNTVQAKIRVDEPGPGLHPEMICRARFSEEPEAPVSAPGSEPVLTIPASAIVREGARTFAFRVSDGVARRLEIRTREGHGDRIVVEAGLSAGDRVVIDPPPYLEDGEKVKE